ncbi:MAG: thioesterase domain-containing protein [Bacteroidales bacterium]|nr:thioesterase domain-containing protein [Bacteroidales bacterium]
MDTQANINELIKELKKRNIELSFANGKLKYSGPQENIDSGILSGLKENKARLIKYLWPDDCPNMMPINTEGSRVPLILLHAGEANYSLSQHLGKDQPFYGFFYIGSEGENIRYKNIESFAAEYVEQLRKIMPEGPYILGGFSMGGILAYEMAVQLDMMGEKVPGLILVDCEIPRYRKDLRAGSRQKMRNIYDYFYYRGKHFMYRLFSPFKLEMPAKFRKLYILWIYSRLMKTYAPEKRYDGSMLLFRTEANDSPNMYLGWDNLADNIDLVSLKGDHNIMYADIDSLSVLKEKISALTAKINS